MTLIAIEVIAFRESIGGMLALIALGGGGVALCLYAWLRFNRQLFFAEHIASPGDLPGLPHLRQVRVRGRWRWTCTRSPAARCACAAAGAGTSGRSHDARRLRPARGAGLRVRRWASRPPRRSCGSRPARSPASPARWAASRRAGRPARRAPVAPPAGLPQDAQVRVAEPSGRAPPRRRVVLGVLHNDADTTVALGARRGGVLRRCRHARRPVRLVRRARARGRARTSRSRCRAAGRPSGRRRRARR